jgi:predicted RNase H-like HicB family nuclease
MKRVAQTFASQKVCGLSGEEPQDQKRYNSLRVGGTMQDYEFTVVIEKDEDGRFLAICPALQGCYTEGETEEEARQLIQDAIRLHVESRLARDEPVYQEVGSHKVRVAV